MGDMNNVNGGGTDWVLILMFGAMAAILLFSGVSAYLTARALRRDGGVGRGANGLEVLRERYARGEIAAEEYEQRLAVLSRTAPAAAPGR